MRSRGEMAAAIHFDDELLAEVDQIGRKPDGDFIRLQA